MKKSNKSGLADKKCTTNEDSNRLNQQVDQQNVQQRYHCEFIKYQEQINKVKQQKNDQAA